MTCPRCSPSLANCCAARRPTSNGRSASPRLWEPKRRRPPPTPAAPSRWCWRPRRLSSVDRSAHTGKKERLTMPLLSRRDFLAGSTLLALAPTVPGFLARMARAAAPPARDERLLVVIEMDGGNDGLNTVVPFRDANYEKLRPTLRQPRAGLLKLNDEVGLHPSLRGLGKLLDAGRLCVVQGVGYPKPSRSHSVSMAVWQTARLGAEEHAGAGWLGRAFDGARRPEEGT